MCCETSSAVEVLKEAGNKAFKTKEYRLASKHYDEALRLASESVDAPLDVKAALFNNRALVLLKLGRYAEALAAADSAAALGPASQKCMYRGACAALHLGRADDASSRLQQLLQQEPKDVEAAALLARAEAVAAVQHCTKLLSCSDDAALSPEQCRTVELVDALLDDDSHTDITDTLAHLIRVLLEHRDARSAFQACTGYAAVLQFLSDSYHAQVAAVLRAAGGGGGGGGVVMVTWPPWLPDRLVGLATMRSSTPLVITAAVELLDFCAKDDWVRTGMAAPGPDGSEAPPTGQLLRHLHSPELAKRLPTEAATTLARLLGRYGDSANSRDALLLLNVKPFQALLLLFHAAPQLKSLDHKAWDDVELDIKDIETQEEVFLFLKKQRKQVANKPATAAQHAVLDAMQLLLTDSSRLLIQEAAVTPEGQSKQRHTPLLPGLIELAEGIHETSPLRLMPILGLDGKPLSFEKRPYAADFKDNPLGESIANAPDDPAQWQLDEQGRLQGQEAPEEEQGLTLLEHALDLLAEICRYAAPTAILYRHTDLTGLLKKLAAYASSPGVLHRRERLYGVMAAHCPDLVDEVCGEGNIAGLTGLLQSRDVRTLQRAVEKLSALVGNCSGDDFERFVQPGGGLSQVLALVTLPGTDTQIDGGIGQESNPTQAAAGQVVVRCLRRARKQQRSPPHALPVGPLWQSLDGGSILSLERSIAATPGAAIRQRIADLHPPSLSSRKSASSSQQQVPVADQRPLPAAPNGTKHQHGSHAAIKKQAADNGYDEDGLREVYDSAPKGDTRAARVAWKNIPLREKVRWTQTSTDISAWIKVPRGTKAKEVDVQLAPELVCFKLQWHGTVFNGALHGRIKASEAHWVVEDDEVHVLMPKADGSYWKSLFEGGAEKSYHEILKEAVEADEPVQPYDQLDDKAKDLIEDINERRSLVSQGLLDPEGFDDFRIVLGENSLKG